MLFLSFFNSRHILAYLIVVQEMIITLKLNHKLSRMEIYHWSLTFSLLQVAIGILVVGSKFDFAINPIYKSKHQIP